MLKKYSLSDHLGKIVVCFCVIPNLPFLLLFIIKAYFYIQQHRVSFLSYVLLYTPQWLLCNFIPLIILFFTGIFITFLAYKYDYFLFRIIVFLIIAFVLFEQVIQFIIIKYHDVINIIIIDGWLKISPIPAIGAENYISARLIDSAFAYPVIILIAYFAYRSCYFWLPKQRNLLKISIIFFSAAIYCSFFNMCFYNNNTYDFIEIEYMAVFDIRDIYLSLWASTIFLLLAEAIPFLKKVKSPKQKIYEYFKWELACWRNMYSKFKGFSNKYFKR
jgi:hypothetical protein